MERSNQARAYFTVLAMCLFLIFAPICVASPQPLWVQKYMTGTFHIPEVYFGVGSASFDGASPYHDERELARKRAINDLSYNLSVVIKSEFANRIAQEGDFTDERIESSLFVTTRPVLSGVEPHESWTDTKKHLHWVLVTIEKQKADKQVAQQNFINEVIDRLEGKQDEVIQGIKTIEEVLSQRLTAYEGKITHLTGLVETIDSKIEHAGNQTRKEHALLQSEIKHLEQVFHTSQSARMEELIRQNKVLYQLIGKVSRKIDKDYFLSLSIDDIQYQQAKGRYYTTITATTRGAIKMRTRGIEVSKPFSSSVATDTCFIVSHPR
ncbi:MAG: LPP20 family lipoprotein [Deltaproteobacteria bacterium]|nr:LPP20 family lipoprotein [Deltaproteobacteria bacterium]MBW2078887.1 LPP20 family lipoprotein [Deltaproteobacteria bacterium]